MAEKNQLAFTFDTAPADQPAASGLERWREERQEKLAKIAATIGLPIGSKVKVTLVNGVVLEGRLAVHDEEHLDFSGARPKNLRLRIDQADFGQHEIETCVRLE